MNKIEVINSKCLSIDEYKIIMNEIVKNHRFGRSFKNTRNIKYVRPNWDMRTGECFNITFNGFKDVTFDFRGANESMYSRIMKWLNGDDNVIFGGLDYQIKK